MASIINVVAVDPNGAGLGDYVVSVLPNAAQPGSGTVRDNHGHSEPWQSFNGQSVDVGIFGTPPFFATQV